LKFEKAYQAIETDLNICCTDAENALDQGTMKIGDELQECLDKAK